MIAAGVTHLIDTIKIRLQKEGEYKVKIKKYHNIFFGLKLIYKQEGYRGIYKGLTPALMREASYSSLRLGLYEIIRNKF